MAKYTVAQAEKNIDDKVTMKHLDVFKDYMETMFNENMRVIRGNFNVLKTAVEGEDRALSHLGIPHPPAAVAPANPNKYDWYFNTLDKRFYMWVKGKWTEIASLGGVVDLSDYYTIEEANEWFLAGSKGTLKELHDIEFGLKVEDQDAKYLNIVGLADILNDQHKVDELFLGKFSDELTYKNKDTIEYKDTILDRTTLQAKVITNGDTVTYSTLITPFKRIEQEQANFEGTFRTSMSTDYQFISKGKALRFTGTRNQKYKWEHVEKYDGNFTREYIRFTGDAQMSIANSFVPGIPSTFTDVVMPYEIRLSELMDTSSGQAIVQFNFDALPIDGSDILKLDYQTSTQFIVDRYTNFFDDIYKRVSILESQRNIYHFPIEVGGFNNITLRYQPTDRPGTMAVGDQFLIDIEPKDYATLTFNDTMTVMLLNEANVGGNPAANFAAVEPFVFATHKTQTDKDNFANARHWSYFKNMVSKYYIVAKKAQDVDGKFVWVTDGWIAKPQEPGDMSLVSRDLNAANVWAEFQSSKALNKLVYLNIHNANQIESNASAFWKDSNLRFDQEGRAVANVSNGHERQFKMTNTGIQIWEQGVLQRTQPYTQWDKFEIFELEGKAFVGYTSNQREADITTWANVGIGHENEVLSFDATGAAKLTKVMSKDEADKLYESRHYDYSDSSLTVTENVTGGKRYQIITQPADALNTPVGANNKILFDVPATPQDADQMTYGTDLIWIVKADGNIMSWGEIKDHVTDRDTMVIKHLSNGNWEFVRWDENLATKLAKKQDVLTKTLTIEFDDGTTEDVLVG